MCSGLYCTVCVCVSTLYDVRTTKISPNDAFLRTLPRRKAALICTGIYIRFLYSVMNVKGIEDDGECLLCVIMVMV